AGSEPSPRASAVDSQSVKKAGQGGEKGYSAGKKVTGRKRHILVDSTSLLLAVLVTTADGPDGRAACNLLHSQLWDELPRLEVFYADSQYRAGCLQEDVLDLAPFRLPVVSRPQDVGGPCPLAPALAGRAHLRLAGPLSPALQGLRAAGRFE